MYHSRRAKLEGSVSVRYGLLALLDEEPSHGYNLKTAFERRTGGSWLLNIGQVYTTIQRLERDGLVQALGGSRDDDRREYRITPAGREQLAAWFDSPVVAEAPARDELTIKVLLAVAAGDIDVTALLQRQRRASVEQLQAYTRRKAMADPKRDVAFLILLDALIFRTEAEVRWLDACDARIRSLATQASDVTQGTIEQEAR
jgi:DNA-binding PadR family transcriptional regulator